MAFAWRDHLDRLQSSAAMFSSRGTDHPVPITAVASAVFANPCNVCTGQPVSVTINEAAARRAACSPSRPSRPPAEAATRWSDSPWPSPTTRERRQETGSPASPMPDAFVAAASRWINARLRATPQA